MPVFLANMIRTMAPWVLMALVIPVAFVRGVTSSFHQSIGSMKQNDHPQRRKPVLCYTFTTRDCLAGSFHNRVIMGNNWSSSAEDSMNRQDQLIRMDWDVVHCAPSMGVLVSNMTVLQREESSPHNINTTRTTAAVTSISSMANIFRLNEISLNNGISIELWFKPDDTSVFTPNQNSFDSSPLLTIGQQPDQLAPPIGLTICDTNGIDLQIVQTVSGTLQVVYRTSDDIFEPCYVFNWPYPGPLGNRITHLVLSLTDQKQQVFIDGQPSVVLQQPFHNNLSHWNMQHHGIELFTYSALNSSVWYGSIYQLSLFSGGMSLDDVKQRLSTLFEGSEPYVLDVSMEINEDAEIVPGSHPPEWYGQQPFWNDSERIQLPFNSIDKEARELLRSLNVTASQPQAPVYFYLSGLPSCGYLYQSDGTTLVSPMLLNSGIIPITSPLAELIYLPPLDSHSSISNSSGLSVYANLTYCVSSFVIFSVHQCQPATMFIRVNPVNDPPIALDVASVSVSEGMLTGNVPKILLYGVDFDTGDAIQLVQVTSPPILGELRLSVATFRKDKLKHGTPLIDIKFTVSGADPVYVNYIWTPTTSSPIVTAIGVIDSFCYRVADSSGVWSVEKRVDIRILSTVTASNPKSLVVHGGDEETNWFQWFPKDDSGYGRHVGIFVEKVPSIGVGVFLDPMTQQPIKAGSVLSAWDIPPYTKGIPFGFVLNPSVCSIQVDGKPNNSYTIQTRAIAFDSYEGQRIVSVSETTTQNILIKCRTDALHLDVPTGPLIVRQMTLRSAATDPCRGSVFDASLVNIRYCERAVVVNDINVTSEDVGSPMALVTVSTRFGFLTFNQQFWNLTEVLSGRRAVSDGNVTFLAHVHNLTNIFADLHYQSFQPGVDHVDIVLLYGDNCTSWDQALGLTPISASCQTVHRAIEVHVMANSNRYEATTRFVTGFPWSILVCWIGYPIVYYVIRRVEDYCCNTTDDDTVCPPEDSLPDWIQHRTDSGDYYYENSIDGTVTWMAPIGQEYLPWVNR